MALVKIGKPTPLNKALLKARQWCDRRTKGEPLGSYSLCWDVQAVLLEEMAKAGLSVVKRKKAISVPRSKKPKGTK